MHGNYQLVQPGLWWNYLTSLAFDPVKGGAKKIVCLLDSLHQVHSESS